MFQIEFKAMGCQMLAALDSMDAAANAALSQVPVWFEQWEQCLSRFRPDSELSELNRRSGQCITTSNTLCEVLGAALAAAHQTAGLVVPTLLPALLAAGYDRSFNQLAVEVGKPIVPPSSSLPGQWRNIEMVGRERLVCLPAGVTLDFGGVAKGWAAQQAVRRLQQYGPALVDAGGDIAISGSRADGSKWPIAVANPFAPEEELELLMLVGGGVSTSGRDYRRWQQGGVERHHIIDPRSGQPAITDVMSATIIAKDALAAEVAAKVALILGSVTGMKWLERHSNLAGLLVLEDGSALHSSRLAHYLWRLTMSSPANRNPELQLDTLKPALSWKAVITILFAVIGGAAFALLVLPMWVPDLSASLTGSEPKGFWYMARASAFVAYILIWLSLVMGLLITNKLARLWPGGPVAFDLHQYFSILGLAFGLFHALILLGDAYSNYNITQLLIPFSASQYRPLWVGLGQMGFYLLLVLTFSFYARRWIGAKGWRLLHFVSFAAFILVLMHGVFSGTDNGETWAVTLYWVTGSAALFLTVYRIAVALLKTSKAMRQRLTGKEFAIDRGTHRRS